MAVAGLFMVNSLYSFYSLNFGEKPRRKAVKHNIFVIAKKNCCKFFDE